MRKIVFILFILPLTIFCNNNNENAAFNDIIKETTSSIDTSSYKKSNKKIEKIYYIKKNSIVFFKINKTEYNILIEELGGDSNWEMRELFNSFTLNAKSLKKALKKHKIFVVIKTNKIYEIQIDSGKTLRFDRTEEEQIVGQIFCDGKKKPLITYGVYTNKEIVKLVKQYFEINTINVIEPNSTKNNKIDSLNRAN